MGEIADDHYSQMWDEIEDEYQGGGDWGGQQPSHPRCNRCGSSDVRWRQQTGQWMLFSLQPGVVHDCSAKPDLDAFDVVPE